MNIQTNKGNEYLNYHKILQTLRLNPYLYNPNFEIGVMDTGIYSNHEDFHNFYQGYLGGGQTSVPNTYHGSLVSSLFGFSQINNDLGIHGIVNARVNFINKGKFSYLEVYKELLRQSSPKVVNISYTQHYCSSYRAYYIAAYDGIDRSILNKQPSVYRDCNLTKESVYNDTIKDQHIRKFQDIRTEILKHPETLFVIAAGNRGVDALWEEGALYYEVDDLGDISVNPVKLDNVLIVGDIDNEGILESYSNYGETVDIAAIGTAYAASTTSTDTNGIVSSFYDKKSGTSFSAPIVAGMASVLFSMDSSLAPKDVKELLLNSGKSTDTRHTGNLLTNRTESVFITPIADLKVSYDVLKARLETEVQMDAVGLQGLTQLVSNENDCVLLWNNGTSSRKVIGSDKSYEAKFYGDRCLYFRGNSFIIDYDLETRTASKLYYNQYNSNRYREYMTFRHFVNNMKSAKTDETWRNGYAVVLNSDGNVGCTIADNCLDGEITTAQQCENLFVALTGVYPSVMNASANLLSGGVCEFRNQTNANIAVMYDQVLGKINIDINLLNDINFHNIFSVFDNMNTKINEDISILSTRNECEFWKLTTGDEYCPEKYTQTTSHLYKYYEKGSSLGYYGRMFQLQTAAYDDTKIVWDQYNKELFLFQASFDNGGADYTLMNHFFGVIAYKKLRFRGDNFCHFIQTSKPTKYYDMIDKGNGVFHFTQSNLNYVIECDTLVENGKTVFRKK